MDLFDEKQPLVIEHPLGGRRVIAALFKTLAGICFFDVGWADPLSVTHPIHFVSGTILGDGPWRIGDSKIEVISDPEELIAYENNLKYEKERGITDSLKKEIFDREFSFI